MDFKKPAKNGGNKTGRQPRNSQDFFFPFPRKGERKEEKEMEWEWECMCDCESVKEGFNAAGLSVQSAPVHRQDFHVSEGLDSKVKLKGGYKKKLWRARLRSFFYTVESAAANKMLKRDRVAPFITAALHSSLYNVISTMTVQSYFWFYFCSAGSGDFWLTRCPST